MNKQPYLTLILNPIAGNGRAQKAYAELKRLLMKNKISFSTLVSHQAGQIVELAHSYAQKERPSDHFLVVIGGDGSLSEAVNGVKHSPHPDLPLAYLPAGSGDDFARAAHLKSEPSQLLALLTNKPQAIQMDCGSYTDSHEPKRITYFVNNLGIGFDASVVHRSNAELLKRRLNKINFGHLIYSLNIVNALLRQDTFMVVVKNKNKILRFGDAYLATTTNHPYFGGGIAILPKANLHSHVLDTVILEKPSLLKFIFLFAKLLKNGSHVTDPHFHYLEGQEIELQTHKPEWGQLDGEDLPYSAYHLKFKIDHFNLIK